MLFTKFSFYIFFVVFVLLFSMFPNKYKKYILLLGNFVFCYFCGIKSFAIAIVVMLFTYCCGRSGQKKLILTGIVFNITVLIIFKYFQSFSPVGISFYTFTNLSYLIDVYSGKTKCENGLVCYANYVLFFPRFISGPIERKDCLLPQLNFTEMPPFSFSNLQNGFYLFLFGLFKKLCIADRIQIYVDLVYGNLERFGGYTLIVASLLYSLQIYCDFSGYTDMAIGIAKVLGVSLSENFRNPYSAVSISDFWRRWHISLSTWLRDYIYIPLGGNRKGRSRKYLNILLTFVVSGIWHGSTVGFLIWGTLHGAYQIIENCLNNQIEKVNSHIRRTVTFLCVTFAWIFFRMETWTSISMFFSQLLNADYYSMYYLKKSIVGINFSTYNNMTPYYVLNFNVFLSIALLITSFIIEARKNCSIVYLVQNMSKGKRYLISYVIIFLIFTVGVFDSTRFIYASF